MLTRMNFSYRTGLRKKGCDTPARNTLSQCQSVSRAVLLSLRKQNAEATLSLLYYIRCFNELSARTSSLKSLSEITCRPASSGSARVCVCKTAN